MPDWLHKLLQLSDPSVLLPTHTVKVVDPLVLSEVTALVIVCCVLWSGVGFVVRMVLDAVREWLRERSDLRGWNRATPEQRAMWLKREAENRW